ncbi:MAG: hypothetical protein JRI65_13800 [Deltaproteobacteria bacterium]|nr:hypothetical protein [Deltaproteobacteria bacterium]
MKTETEDIRIWKKYKAPVVKVLKELRAKRELRKVCREKLKDMNPARLSEMISGKTDVSSYYVGMFINGGIMTLDYILQGKEIRDLAKEDRRIFIRLALDDETVDMIGDLEEKEISLKSVLKGILKG